MSGQKSVENPRQVRSQGAPTDRSMVTLPSATTRAPGYSKVDIGDSTRIAFMLTPEGPGEFRPQLDQLLGEIRSVLRKQPQSMEVTVQTIFLRDLADEIDCRKVLHEFYGDKMPVTNFVAQPPGCGAALAIEAWSIGGKSVRIERVSPETLVVGYDGVRWVYTAGIRPARTTGGVHEQTLSVLKRASENLAKAGSRFENVVRTWFYLGEITNLEGSVQRYQELNRARTDYYSDIRFCRALLEANAPRGVYPASTGIGASGNGLVMSCLALDTNRKDIFLLPLENPQQTPAYAYHPRYSSQSPKFSRAMALCTEDYVTTWVSGTASIVDSESRHHGDIEKQTEQTIDNIERLVAPDNFELHGIQGTGARLHDFAKFRVYIKRPQDFAKCRAVCQRRFGRVPAIYALADVCRPELLVEIEGVAFAHHSGGTSKPQK
jgi:enamine deaminase RidA (YjgF/YER057c/UK114 family)